MTALFSFAKVRPDRPAAERGHRSGRVLVKLVSLFAVIFVLLAGPARADDYPSRPITLILPRRIGDVFEMRDAPVEQLRSFLAEAA